MSLVTDEQVVTRLGSIGVPPESLFVVNGDSEGEGLIAFWHPEVGVRFLILENDALAKACYEYLLRQGVRQFTSGDEIGQTAAAERWPGWDTCDEAIRARRTSST
ncbi:MAG: hypothetical protein U0871_28280 [Gemmataceae bacterium]